MKAAIKQALASLGVEVKSTGRRPKNIPDGNLYRPYFSPWLSAGFDRHFALTVPQSMVSRDRCYVLYCLVRQSLAVPGNVWECGVYKGGTAKMLAALVRENGAGRVLRLFDTFAGMPKTDAQRDLHSEGDFADTSVEAVKSAVGAGPVELHQGFIPDSFAGLEGETIAFAHIDLDIYKSILDSLSFIWPRLSQGGAVVFDDYGAPTCPGARRAVDEFFADKPEVPLCLGTGQAIVFRSTPPGLSGRS